MARATSATTDSLATTGVACPGSGTARLISEGTEAGALLRVMLALEEGGLAPRNTRLVGGSARSHALIVLGKPPSNLQPVIPDFSGSDEVRAPLLGLNCASRIVVALFTVPSCELFCG
jgi:hypothetical protein